MMTNNSTIGNRIKELREAQKETQADLAKAFNVKRETVSMWESGARDLKTIYTVRLAEHLETTCDYILRGVQTNNVSIHEKTGLCDEAIINLANASSHQRSYINLFLSNKQLLELIS